MTLVLIGSYRVFYLFYFFFLMYSNKFLIVGWKEEIVSIYIIEIVLSIYYYVLAVNFVIPQHSQEEFSNFCTLRLKTY